MLSSRAKLFLLIQAWSFCVAAHRDWWLQSLPSCWRGCMVENGCSSRKCMCESSVSFLPSFTTCAMSQCKVEKSDLDFFLRPLQLYCNAIDCPISSQVINRVYTISALDNDPHNNNDNDNDTDDYGSEDSEASPAWNVYKPPPTTPTLVSTAFYKIHKSGPKSKSIIMTTSTPTTTDAGEEAVQTAMSHRTKMGSSTCTTHIGTREANRKTSITSTMTATTMEPTTSVLTPVAATTSLSVTSELQSSPTSAEKLHTSPSTKTGNGTPFENMQAMAGHWHVPVRLLCLAAVGSLFVRL